MTDSSGLSVNGGIQMPGEMVRLDLVRLMPPSKPPRANPVMACILSIPEELKTQPFTCCHLPFSAIRMSGHNLLTSFMLPEPTSPQVCLGSEWNDWYLVNTFLARLFFLLRR